MVSTRGGARTRAEDPKTMLSQKPRRATAKTTQAATTKTKTTRSKKAAAEPEPEQTEDELQEQLEEEAPKPVKKATRKTTAAPAAKADVPKQTRTATKVTKKDEKATKAAPPARTATRATRAGDTKPAKAKPTVDAKPELPPPAEKKATRATRATASKEKATPLSPKKITQVSKAPARTTRTAATKAATAKQPISKPPARGRPAVRRNVSDENADAKALKDSINEQSEDDESTRKMPKRKLTRKVPVEPVEEETPVSTAPSTPARESEDQDGSSEDELQEDVAEDDDEASECEDGAEDESEDELCGPKSPMKRCSPREGSRYVSPKKSVRDLDVPEKTPVRRIHGTPQTQRNYNKPSFGMSAMKPAPTTVARARDRAMVFPKLERLPELKTVPNEGGDQAETDKLSLLENDEPSSAIEDSFASNLGTAEDTMFVVETDEEVADMPSINNDTEEANVDMAKAPSEVEEDPDETIVEEPVPATQEDFVNGSDDSMMMVHDEPDIHMEDSQISTAATEPETMVWENIREDVTIPFNFDTDLAARALPQVEHTERLSLVSGVLSSDSQAQDMSMPDIMQQLGPAEAKERQSISSTRQSLGGDATVNISDFIDVNSLSESSTEVVSDAETVRITALEESGDEEVISGDDQDSTYVEEARASFPTTPEPEAAEQSNAAQESRGRSLPRYATSTIASRSKSLPASPYRTPLRDDPRPKTSDGFSMPRLAQTTRPSWLRSPSRLSTPAKSRISFGRGASSTTKRGRSRTPAARTPYAKTPGTSVPETSKLWKGQRTPVSRTLFARTPGTSVPVTVTPAVRERFAALPARRTYEEFASTDDASTATPRPAVAASATKERFPGLPTSQTYEDLLKTPGNVVATPVSRSSTRRTPFSARPSQKTPEELKVVPDVEDEVESDLVTPQPVQEERYPGLPTRRTYEEHAKTTMPASRFQTPPQLSVAKRPATTQKPGSLRKFALKTSTTMGSRTPMKTPLRGTAMTPGQELMTPHPAAPLRGVVALAEVYTSDGSCATPAFVVLLQRLGAKTTKTFSERVTHVVFKEGSPQLLQRLRIHNKQVAETGIGNEIHCVNSRWLTDCDTQGRRVDETDEIYAVDIGEVPRSAKRRRKSMEPTSLLNIGGNVIRDRKSSLGRSSLGRLKSTSPSELNTEPPKTFSIAEKENSGDDAGSPATPAYLAAPESLVMQTEAPKRVKKLNFGDERLKNRRQTFLDF